MSKMVPITTYHYALEYGIMIETRGNVICCYMLYATVNRIM